MKLVVGCLLALIFCPGYSLLSYGQLFTPLPAQFSGLHFKNEIIESDSLNIFIQKFPYMSFSGAGISVADFDADGKLDVLMLGNQVPSKFFQNKGNLQFEEVKKVSGFSTGQWTNAAAVADINLDGLPDIFLCKMQYPNAKFGGNQLFINKGNFKFEEKTYEYGLTFNGNSVHASFFDYDNDGLLDLYLINQPLESFEENTFDVYNRNQDYKQSDILYRNTGNNRFENLSKSAGLLTENAFGLSVITADVNNDHLTDIFVGNDYVHRDFLYINNGNGTFSERMSSTFSHSSFFTMGSTWCDFNNDGLSDLFTLDMNPLKVSDYKVSTFDAPIDKYNLITKNHFRQEVRNVLQLNRGNGTFAEVGQLFGVAFSDWSWAALGEDFNNDGFKDLYITNGLLHDVLDRDFMKYSYDSLLRLQGNSAYQTQPIDLFNYIKIPPRKTKNQLHLNENGHRLNLVSDSALSNLKHNWVTTAALAADFDQDGDMDIVLSNADTSAFILRNNTNNASYIKIRFEDSNLAWNAKVSVFAKGKTYFQEITHTQGILCGRAPEANVGLGNATGIDSIVVEKAGKKAFFITAEIGSSILVKASDFKSESVKNKPLPKAFFKQTTLPGFDFKHIENDFNDIKKEPLLYKQQSVYGPYTAKGDLDGNGWEDIVIGGSCGNPAVIYYQQTDGSFELNIPQCFKKDAIFEDGGIALLDANSDGKTDVFIAAGGNENFPDSSYYRHRLYLNKGNRTFERCMECIPQTITSGSVALVLDFDNDSKPDLFVGGRNQPGKFPLAAPSMLLRNVGGVFNDETPHSMRKPGMVFSAVALKPNSQDFPDLYLTGEWMPVLRFKNDKGRFLPPDTIQKEGWYQHLAYFKPTNDTTIGWLIGNIGLNTRFVPNNDVGIRLYFSDADKNGSIDPILCTYEDLKWKPVLPYEKITKELPYLRKKFNRYRDYRDASVYDCLPDGDANYLKAYHPFSSLSFDSSHVLRNYAGVLQTSVFEDFNHDGYLDVLVHGNFYEFSNEIGPVDASDGLLLLFEPGKGFVKPPTKLGFSSTGNVRQLFIINTVQGKRMIVLKNNATAECWQW